MTEPGENVLILGVRYLRGCVVATEAHDRESVEWPPHPGRLFMAMVSAWGETGSNENEKRVLEWLEELSPPDVICGVGWERSPTVSVYVPANDRTVKAAARNPFNGLPSLYKKSDRTFPIADLANDTVFFRWRESIKNCPHPEALEPLCEKIARIGHSSSMTQVWVASEDEINAAVDEDGTDVWKVSETGSTKFRVPDRRTLDALESDFAMGLEAQVHTVRSYSKAPSSRTDKAAIPATSFFSPDLLVLSKLEGTALGLRSTFQISASIRSLLMSRCPDPIPEWLSGHRSESARSEEPHLAIVPLPYVGGRFGDGHLMGAALVFPREEHSSIFEQSKLSESIGPIFFDESGEEIENLTLFPNRENSKGQSWEWEIRRESGTSLAKSLRSRTWTRPSTMWASVTPVVLPKHPKKNRKTNRAAWDGEVQEIIALACIHSGLPQPSRIRISQISKLSGVPPCHNFPVLPERTSSKGNRSCRIQTHAVIEFAEEVGGPVLIGSGRYVGYGFFKPISATIEGAASDD